jgi:capsule polysaccharide modification protein KpsS
MKILFVGHDISYVRFYSAVEIKLREKVKVESIHIYSRPSAWVYSKWVLCRQVYSPCLVRFKLRSKENKKGEKSNIDLRFYHKAIVPQQGEKLTNLFCRYVDFILSIIPRNGIDIAILPGEFRIFEQAAMKALRLAAPEAKIIYFEAGPPGYIYLDQQGVNANASFSQTRKNKLVDGLKKPLKIKCSDSGVNINNKAKPRNKNISNKGLLGLDCIWLVFSKMTFGLIDLEEYWEALANRVRSLSSRGSGVIKSIIRTPYDGYLLYLGQVKNDINHTHFGLSDIEIQNQIIAILKSDPLFKIIWRDHPLEKSDALFKSIFELFPGRIYRSEIMTLGEVMKISVGVISVNSNGALEALAVGLPVRLLGRAYYENLEGVCRDNESFQSFCAESRLHGPNKQIIIGCETFIRDCFLPIDYRNNHFENANLAADAILLCQL